MSYQRLAYDDASTADQMTADCAAVDLALHLVDQRQAVSRMQQVGDGQHAAVVVSEDLAALAAGLELHFD